MENIIEGYGKADTQTGKLLDVRELAGRLGCTERHVFNLIRRRKIPAIKCGRLVRFNWASVLRKLEEQ
jgi:excisionase family DNA binding protein